ncbi:MAG: signal peptidase II [Deltaproteobacteria bacterium]
MSRKLAILLPVLVAGLVLDQVSKALISLKLPVGGKAPVIPGLLNLVNIHNKGAAFGLFSGWSAQYAWLFFVATTALVLAVLGYLLWRLPEDHWPAALGYSLILTGALGNLIDRLRLGEVVDFIDVYYGHYHWPAFNVADSLVCVGAAVLVWVVIREEKTADASHPV